MNVPKSNLIKTPTLTLLVIFFIIKHCDSLNNRHKDQQQNIQSVIGDNSDILYENGDNIRTKRDAESINTRDIQVKKYRRRNSSLVKVWPSIML